MTLALAPTATPQRSGRYPDLPVEPAGWREDGNCQSSALEFTPTFHLGASVTRDTTTQRAQCASCPVITSCALDALKQLSEFGRLDGVWAGQIATSGMKPAARRTLIAHLGDIAGLPADHYLIDTDHGDRRRKQIHTMLDHGYGVATITRYLGVRASAVKREMVAATP